jgi:micrococcal nuclease
VRLLGIDTPESVAPDRPVECYGPEATEVLAGLVPRGTEVRLERDVEARDRFGRLLAYVFRQPDGLFVNEALAAAGAADTLSIEPNTAYAARLAGAVAGARAAGLGRWGAC